MYLIALQIIFIVLLILTLFTNRITRATERYDV